MTKGSRSSSVLVVDDDHVLVEVLALWLEAEGFSVRRAYNGLQGLADVIRAEPDLVLADISMPGMDGVHLAMEMRKRGVPIILLSAAVTPPESLPDVPFIGKPFDLEEVHKVILDILSNEETRQIGSNGSGPPETASQ